MSTYFNIAVPILWSGNVIRSLDYYTDVLKFDGRWDWGNPPSFGGVHKDSVQIFFCENGQGHAGTWLSIMVNNVDEYFETIRANGADIVAEPKSMEWSIREMLVKDPDGHMIRFGHGYSVRERSEEHLTDRVRIVSRVPTPREMNDLASAVGWDVLSETPSELPLSAVAHIVVAEEKQSGALIGTAFLLSDGAGFYYVKNVIVHPDWQRKRIGTALMRELTNWLEANAPNNAFITLNTGENLAPFYKQFGFAPAFSMMRRIKK